MSQSPQNDTASPWHEGEKTLQASVGKLEKMDLIGRKVLRDHLPEQHSEFYTQLPYIMTGSVDAEGQVWASVLAGEIGFISCPTPTRMHIAAHISPEDPAFENFKSGDGLGLLGIEFHTRRRNRINGRIDSITPSGFDVHVEQTMGNCAKYIQDRDYELTRPLGTQSPHPPEITYVLDQSSIDLIRRSDSFYVASYVTQDNIQKVDVSHRGGKPGFVRVDDQGVLTIPDFTGNVFFNTLGNILINGKAGLNFIDYETGDMLQMTGQAEIVFDSPEIAQFAGAERLWTFKPSKIVRRKQALPFRWTFNELSPFVVNKGSWDVVSQV
ncbi:pyridoxamine 5'-phosphate oxidase family protein [Hirschia litorea]|uniref:Pyridoxamine 5'-phosphate oxidase family protein n=1 Tax=Hirschia litorea TaxID=1199156 RepID=A0ABW2IQ83_9PROT